MTIIALAWSDVDHSLHVYAIADTLRNICRNRQAADKGCNLVEHASDLQGGY